MGFTAQELAAALSPAGTAGLTDENEAPALAKTAVTVTGEIWCLARHRVACGDSTDPAVVKALLGTVQPHLMVTDPPYGVEYDPTWRQRLGVGASARNTKVRNDERADWAAAFERRSSGLRSALLSAKAIIIGNTNPAGMRCARKETGRATASKRRFGISRAEDRTSKPRTARRNPSNACGGRC